MTKKNRTGMNEKRCVIPIIRVVGITVSVLIIMYAIYSCASPGIEMVDVVTKTTNLSYVSNMMEKPCVNPHQLLIVDYVERAIIAHEQRKKNILADFWSVTYINRCSNPNKNAKMTYCGTCIHPKEPLSYWSTTLSKEYKKGKPFRAVVDSFSIVEHPTIKSIYGVTLKLALNIGGFLDSG